MHRSTRLILLALTLVVAGLGAIGPAASPALADHKDLLGHWGNGFAPELVIDSSPGYGVHFANVQDAAGYWQDTNFINGFRNLFSPVYDNTGCAERGGAIKFCEVGIYDSRIPVGADSTFYSHDVCDRSDGCPLGRGQHHLYSMTVFIRAGLGAYRTQQVYRHEMGHALGLWHTADLNCVMRSDANVPVGYRCQHDLDSMRDMYIYHRTG